MKNLILLVLLSLFVLPVTGMTGDKLQIDAITNISEIENSINSLIFEADRYIENYNKDKDAETLASAYDSITKAYDKIYQETKKASNLSTDAYERNKNYQIDKASYLAFQIRYKKFILLGSSLLPSICEKLYEIGELYKESGDTIKAKKVFRYIVIKFTTYEFKSCAKQAEFALEDLKDNK